MVTPRLSPKTSNNVYYISLLNFISQYNTAAQYQLHTSSSATAERPPELGDFNKVRVNGGTDNDSEPPFLD